MLEPKPAERSRVRSASVRFPEPCMYETLLPLKGGKHDREKNTYHDFGERIKPVDHKPLDEIYFFPRGQSARVTAIER